MAEEAKSAADTPPPPPGREDGEVAEATAGAPAAAADAGPHPLEHKWTFWEHKAAEKKTMSKKEWGELQRKLFTYDTVHKSKFSRRVSATAGSWPPRHRRDACTTAWRCRFLTARRSQHGRVVHPTHWLFYAQV